MAKTVAITLQLRRKDLIRVVAHAIEDDYAERCNEENYRPSGFCCRGDVLRCAILFLTEVDAILAPDLEQSLAWQDEAREIVDQLFPELSRRKSKGRAR